MNRQRFFAMVIGCVLLGAAQVRADVLPVFLTSGEGDGISTQASCTARCAGGTTLTVNCAGGCQASDVWCPLYEGYVTCNGAGTSYCPSSCPVGTYCDEVDSGFCYPLNSTTSCYRSDGLSYTCICQYGGWNCLW